MTPLLVALAAAAAVLLWWAPPTLPWTPATERDGAGLWPGGVLGWVRAAGRAGPAESPGSYVPEALDLLGLALRGGGSLAEAARTVALVLPGQSGEGLARVAEELRRGRDTEQAWVEAGEEWEPARRCLELARVAGVAPGTALRQTAADLRAARIADVEVGTARLGVRMVLPLGLAFLPAFVLTTVLPLVLALTRDLTW